MNASYWLFKANSIEHVHTQYCECILHVKLRTQNNFVYGALETFNF